MKALRLTLSLAFFVPVLALLSAIAAADTYFPAWGGAAIGATLGLFFGLAFGGALPRSVADYCFGPEDPDTPG
jgi:hydrogenase/urease accessory protein HupE